MIAHKIIQQLREGKQAADNPLAAAQNRQLALDIADELEKAEKFFFDNIPFEQSEPSKWALPELTRPEREMWLSGLLPLPAERCWFEFILGGSPVGILVKHVGEEKTDFVYTRIDYVNNRAAWVPVMLTVEATPEFAKHDANLKVSAYTNKIYSDIAEADANFGTLVIYLCLMLLSKTTELKRNAPSRVMNRIARDHGKVPRFSHTIVTIVPQRYVSVETEPGKKTGSHPRLHWRRSHIRHFDHPVTMGVFVPVCACCKKPNQWIVAIPRFLVGKRELGEVTHDYRVKG